LSRFVRKTLIVGSCGPGRAALGLVACIGAWLAIAGTAWAQDSISVSATASGNTVVVQATGSAPECAGIYCTVDVTVSSSSNGTSCYGDDSPQGSTGITSSDGSFAFTFNVPESAGDQYVVCGYVESGGYAYATSQPAYATIPATACKPGTQHALSLGAPLHLPYRQQGLVTVQESISSSQTVSSAALTMQAFTAMHPFYSYVFTAGDVNQLNNLGEVDFDIEFSPGGGPAQITLWYQQTDSDFSSAVCIDRLTATVYPYLGLRSCGNVPLGIGINVRATGNVICTKARHVAADYHRDQHCFSQMRCPVDGYSCGSGYTFDGGAAFVTTCRLGTRRIRIEEGP
jgi:hypothetical protein